MAEGYAKYWHRRKKTFDQLLRYSHLRPLRPIRPEKVKGLGVDQGLYVRVRRRLLGAGPPDVDTGLGVAFSAPARPTWTQHGVQGY